MKKFLSLMLVLTMAVMVLFTGCSKNGSQSTSSNSNSKFKVYLITMDKMDQHWVSVDKGASDMAKIAGVTYKWDAPDKKDNAKQIECVNNAVADGANLILLAANDPVAISAAVADAKAKGVKIIYVDSPANEAAIATLSTDNYGAGKTAGETMIKEFDAAGKSSGSIGIVSVNTATNSTMNREAGFRDAITADGRFTLLTTEYKDGDAAASQEAAAGFITGNPDLVGLFGANEGSTVGVGNAIKANNSAIIGVGFDKSDAIQNLLNDGTLKAAMAQNPYTMGYLGMAQAIAALNGYSTGPATIDTGVAVLTKAK
jgi:ribose transport system substrate-binding protein